MNDDIVTVTCPLEQALEVILNSTAGIGVGVGVDGTGVGVNVAGTGVSVAGTAVGSAVGHAITTLCAFLSAVLPLSLTAAHQVPLPVV